MTFVRLEVAVGKPLEVEVEEVVVGIVVSALVAMIKLNVGAGGGGGGHVNQLNCVVQGDFFN